MEDIGLGLLVLPNNKFDNAVAGMLECHELHEAFMSAVENPKPAPEYLKEMFRRYGSGTRARPYFWLGSEAELTQ